MHEIIICKRLGGQYVNHLTIDCGMLSPEAVRLEVAALATIYPEPHFKIEASRVIRYTERTPL